VSSIAAILILTSGCSKFAIPVAPVAPVVSPVSQPSPAPSRFQMYGSPERVALLVDSETGKVWKYDNEKAVLVSVNGESPDSIKIVRDAQGNIVEVH